MSAAELQACPAFDPPRPEKIKQTVFAHAALAGVSVIEIADGTFLCTWRGWLKPCADLAAVQHLVRQLGGTE